MDILHLELSLHSAPGPEFAPACQATESVSTLTSFHTR
jgi:hypothetical protein